MEKTVLIYVDEKKVVALLAERVRFCKHLNEGVQYLKSLPFVEEGQCPTFEDLKDPVAWFDSCILKATQPRKIKGISPDPRALAETYRVDYDTIIVQINKVPWNAIGMVDFVKNEFQITPKIKQKVRESASVFGTPEIAEEFKKLEVLLEGLNEFCSKFVSDRMNMNAIAEGLFCRYIQLPDKTRRIVPNARALINVMEHSNAIS